MMHQNSHHIVQVKAHRLAVQMLAAKMLECQLPQCGRKHQLPCKSCTALRKIYHRVNVDAASDVSADTSE